MNNLFELINMSGFFFLTPQMLIMWGIAAVLFYLAIAKQFEPLLLLPIGFGILLANLPLTGLMEHGDGLIWRFYHYGIQWEVIPPIIFLGVGAMTDFGPVLSNPKLLFLGAGAQVGVYITFLSAYMFGFDLSEAAVIGIIGGADGPTTIYLGAKMAPELLGSAAVAAYSYMAMVPIVQPPVMKLFTTKNERTIRMKTQHKAGKLEKILFPFLASLVIILLIPPAAPLMAMFMLGNIFRESKVVERLNQASQNELMNIATIFLGLPVGATMNAETFLKPEVIFIFALGLIAFMISTASGVLLAKFMNLFLRQGNKINPLVGGAGVSAVPMSARVVQTMGIKEDKKNYLLMHAMGPNVAGVIGTVMAAGIFLSLI
ncbi:MAG: sodium ion-translocating decarboxylase subunit beta [Desulfohalobiaceae bacterium]|nr:sodium ion-translocating decarboxylase subunit beta [Desulfohalobiaceae bacterium]